jgi:hypothetical protein
MRVFLVFVMRMLCVLFINLGAESVKIRISNKI